VDELRPVNVSDHRVAEKKHDEIKRPLAATSMHRIVRLLFVSSRRNIGIVVACISRAGIKVSAMRRVAGMAIVGVIGSVDCVRDFIVEQIE
jgi:hypothetical protein